MGEITDRVLRSTIADRDAELTRKEEQIVALKKEEASLREELRAAWKHPLTEDDEKLKVILSDYEGTVELMSARIKNPLGSLSLFDVVRNAVVALDMIREDRDRQFSALRMICSAADEARKVCGGTPARVILDDDDPDTYVKSKS